MKCVSILTMQSSLEMSILGQKVSIKAQGDPEITDEVVRMVGHLIQSAETRLKGKNAQPHHAALLALFDLAEDYVTARSKISVYQKEVERKVEEIGNYLPAE